MITIVYGPQGCGKTPNAEALRVSLGCKRVVDDWPNVGEQIADGDLLLTNLDARQVDAVAQYMTAQSLGRTIRHIHFCEAVKHIAPEPRGEFSIGGDIWPGLSKLAEEAGEVGDLLPELILQKLIGRTQQVVGKIVGNEGRPDHWDGSNLPERLTEELGDLQAAIDFVAEKNGLDRGALMARRLRKGHLFRKWHRETQQRRSAA